MIFIREIAEKPTDYEAEKASNSYLMSVVALIGGLPLPILNLLASIIFFFSNRKESLFIRWHCTQALLCQLSVLFINSYGFWWTVSIIFGSTSFTSNYFAYIIAAFILNLIEFIATIYAAINVRKGKHIEIWFYGRLTNLLFKK